MKTFLMAAVAVCAFAAPSAQAATMTFSGVTTSTASGAYTENGITMTNPTAGGYYYGYLNAGTLHLDQGASNGIYDFTFGTGTFDLAGVDVAVAGAAASLGTFTAFDAANLRIGTASFSAGTTGTKAVSLTGVTRLRLVATGTHFNIDNLVLNASATGAVPEPATWATMMIGFGGMGYAMRRRSKVGARIRFA